MPNTLLTNSDRKKDIAYKIIENTSVIDIFSNIGKVEIVGSLKLDLMYRNDIDLLVISNDISNTKAVDITNKLLKSKKFRTVGYADYQNYPDKEFPLGYYWELIVLEENEEWKFDIWYLKPDEIYTKLVMDSINSFSKELSKHTHKREIILSIKKEYFNGVKYKDNIKSIDIYKAVLESHINTIQEFGEYMRDNN